MSNKMKNILEEYVNGLIKKQQEQHSKVKYMQFYKNIEKEGVF